MAKNKNKLVRNRINRSTQQYLDISEVKEDTVIMKDGTLRVVLMVSSINFSLKSEDEQNAIISSYVSFLNNLSFPLQIVIQSRTMNIDDYLKRLGAMEKEQTNELLKMQTIEYIEYIQELVSIGKIMNKHFYLIVPYNPLSDKHKTFTASFLEALKPATQIKLKEERFLRYKSALVRRVENVSSSLNSIGLSSVQLDTQGLIELFYNTYNPVNAENEKLKDIKKLRVVS